jgi:hypothetical protein
MNLQLPAFTNAPHTCTILSKEPKREKLDFYWGAVDFSFSGPRLLGLCYRYSVITRLKSLFYFCTSSEVTSLVACTLLVRSFHRGALFWSSSIMLFDGVVTVTC